MDWVLDLVTEADAIADVDAFEVVANTLRASAEAADSLVAYHPGRGSIAVWMGVRAVDAAGALRVAESAISLAVLDAGVERPPAIARVLISRPADV